MKKTLLLGLLAVSFLMTAVSCKKCTVAEEDTISGTIVTNATIYANTGYITSESPSNIFNGEDPEFADRFKVSFDGGLTRVPVNYGSYTILANPMTVNCKASLEKSVTRDDINNVVRYKAVATTCKSCEQERFIENYVLVSKIPSNYTVLFESEINAN